MAQRPREAPSAKSVQASQPRSNWTTEGKQLQSIYDTYAENIHAISIRADSNSSLSGYGTLTGQGTRRSRNSMAWRLSSWQTGFHLVSFMAGSGLVFMPFALVEMDWYGLLVLGVAAVISIYTMQLLVEAMDILRWSSGKSVTYADLSRECFGPMAAYATDFLIYGGYLVNATGYLTIVAACLSAMTGARFGVMLVVVCAGVWFHVLVKSLKALAVFSAINVGIAFWIEVVIFGDATYPLKQIALDKSAFTFGTADLSDESLFIKFAYSFTLAVGGFFCHSILPMVYNAMEDHRQCSKVAMRSQLSTLGFFYLPICVVTYAVYGDTLQAPVFFNMRNAIVRNLAIVLYCIHLLLSYTVTIFPLQRALEQRILQPNTTSPSRLEEKRQSSILLAASAHGSGDSLASKDESSQEDSLLRRHERLVQIVSRTMVLLLTATLAYFFQLNTMGTLVGMIVPVTMLSLVLPCVFYWKLCTEEAGCLDKLAIIAIVSLACLSMAASASVVLRVSATIAP
ncbi:hypothetical protein Poli38472_011069 [Pythium oligandrum]|uniref:Amino acid transporter transmembrane domain-containing protein n=1 Tax=Pythium oligandrum TaxID=41045 RepID=A0A8K1CPX4_PYTOL|nr:hypothetical protein Poli38472_011069 [Pythium oligandrum]|eukprot:TMW67449.1 hypothetical protein Poli38472_011069 [Pythium oligandrum]